MAVYELSYQRLAQRPRRHESPALAIALSDLRVLRRRKALRMGFLLLGAFTLGIVGYVVIRNGLIDQLLPESWHGFSDKLPAINTAFFDAIFRSTFYQFLIFLLTLFAGSGRIAEDLRANALAIYLAKPLTRADYLLGKAGATATIVGLGAIGTPLLVYLVAVLASPGFLAANLRLGLALLVLGLCTTAYHTAAVLFFSSLVRSGRLAGLLYAALYFMTGKVELAIDLALRTNRAAFLGYSKNVDTLAAHLFGTAGERDPALVPALGMMALVIGLGLAFARRRVRAVEVVQ